VVDIRQLDWRQDQLHRIPAKDQKTPQAATETAGKDL
jgi:hypothetical protein